MYKYLAGLFLTIQLMCITFISNANETDVLTIDRVVSNNIALAFPNESNQQPKFSDFEVNNYVTMSNELGERWAVITLTNTSTGNRVFEEKHIMALFADGKRKNPKTLKLHFEGKETQSITVLFGQSKFPILSIHSNNV